MEDQLSQRLVELERRLQILEDERAIAQLIAAYGPLVDAGEAAAAARLWATDGTYTVEAQQMAGRDAVRAMVESDAHQRLIGRGSAHFLGPAVITVDGDQAQAVCESLLCVRRGQGRDGSDGRDGYAVWRATANHFRLARIERRWQIVARTSQLLDGGDQARTLLSLLVNAAGAGEG
ncbi:MAG TPA: nuclear transport factor 2 family protein [Mycobacterium sp.]|nr:nuclear transport factor 2 family protein [Mycobacterium sp.]